MLKKLLILTSSLVPASCTTTQDLPPLPTVQAVDLKKFMGDWYVISNIPTIVEKGAHNAIEHYDLNTDGTIAITFTYFKDAFDGPLKRYTMTGTPVPGTNNAQWTVSPFWPLRFPYHTIELDPDYQWVVVATPNRSYLWIMARSPRMDETLLKTITDRMIGRGFKAADIQRVPQSWGAKAPQ
jgi:apolipoprotein D and lipocalin family protein